MNSAALAGRAFYGIQLLNEDSSGLPAAAVSRSWALSASPAIPEPAALEPDIHFWMRVYSEISTNAGFIHDQRDLSVVYETLHFDPAIAAARARTAGHGGARALPGHSAPTRRRARRRRTPKSSACASCGRTPCRRGCGQAADDVRFQLGQSDRFRAGLQRAGIWESHIAQTLAAQGLAARDRRAPARGILVPAHRHVQGRCRRNVAVHPLDRSPLPAHRQRRRRAPRSLPLHRSGRAAAVLQLPAARQLAAGDHRLQPRRRGHAPGARRSSGPTTSCASCASTRARASVLPRATTTARSWPRSVWIASRRNTSAT